LPLVQVTNLMLYPDFEQNFEMFEPLRSMQVGVRGAIEGTSTETTTPLMCTDDRGQLTISPFPFTPTLHSLQVRLEVDGASSPEVAASLLSAFSLPIKHEVALPAA
jgi:hypothetical protein